MYHHLPCRQGDPPVMAPAFGPPLLSCAITCTVACNRHPRTTHASPAQCIAAFAAELYSLKGMTHMLLGRTSLAIKGLGNQRAPAAPERAAACGCLFPLVSRSRLRAMTLHGCLLSHRHCWTPRGCRVVLTVAQAMAHLQYWSNSPSTFFGCSHLTVAEKQLAAALSACWCTAAPQPSRTMCMEYFTACLQQTIIAASPATAQGSSWTALSI